MSASDDDINVTHNRAGIISDQEKLKYLQDYVRTQCLR